MDPNKVERVQDMSHVFDLGDWIMVPLKRKKL